MKRRIISALLVLNVLFANAQQQGSTVYSKRIISRYEVLLGANLISVTGSDHLEKYRIPKWGFRGGLSLIHTFSDRVELDAKISYENKGYRTRSFTENPGPPPTDEFVDDLTLSYITLTLFPRYSILPNRRVMVGVGPYIGWLTNVRVDQKLFFQETLVSRFRRRFDAPWFYREIDLGASFMIGSNFIARKSRPVTIQFIYSIGLRDTPKPSNGIFRNNVFSLLLGMSLQKQ
jgi:hypothetical protein